MLKPKDLDENFKNCLGSQPKSKLRTAAPDAPVVAKRWADSLHETYLSSIFGELGATDLFSTVSEMIHLWALRALSPRVKMIPSSEAIAEGDRAFV